MFIFNRFCYATLFLTFCLALSGNLAAQFTITATGGAPSDPFTDDGRILVDLVGTSQGPYTVSVNGTPLPGTFAAEPFVITDLAAGTYTVEVSGADNGAIQSGIVVDDPCFTTYDPATCDEDPSGYFYCSGTGEIITGGTIAVTAANGSPVIITADGSDGYYKFLINPDLADTYTITYTLPGTFTIDPSRLSPDPYMATDNFPRNELGGADATNNGTVDNFGLRMSDPNFNQFFAELVYDGNAGEGPVTLNNIPLLCAVEIEAEGKATCDPAMDDSNTAVEGEYYVQIDTVFLANGGVVTVEIDGVSQTFDTDDPDQAPLLFGPYTNSAMGGDFKTANLTSDDGQSTGILEIPEVICGLTPLDMNGDPVMNGTGYFCDPTNDPDDVPTGVIVAQAEPGTFLSGGTSGRKQQYVLLGTDSIIVAVNMTGIFRDLTSDDYIVYAINYRTDETGEVEDNLNVGDDFTEFTAARRGESSAVDGNCFILCGPVDITVEPCMSIGSTVFTDNNNDGILNMTDAGINMVEVVLTTYDTDGNVVRTDTTETNADGSYYFGGLAEGDYTVHLTAANFDVGGPLENSPLSSTPAAGEVDDAVDNNDNGIQVEAGDSIVSPLITLEGGTEPTDAGTETGQNADQDNNPDDPDEDANGNMTVDFGVVPNLSIGSFVYIDNNNDGMYDQAVDAADMGLEGVQVILLQDDGTGNFVEVNVGPDGMLGTADDAPGGVTTAADGSYLFSNLPAGDYQVQLPAANFMSGGGAEMYPLSSTPTVGADAGAANVDDDDNGIQDGGLGTVITSPTISLSAGDEPGAAAETGIGNGQDDDANQGFVDTNGDMTIDFGLTPPMSIGSTVFFDMDADGVQDPTDPQEFGIEGVTVQLFQDVDMDGTLTGDELTPVQTVMTDMDGNYLFDSIPPGIYQVVIPTAPASAPMNTEGAEQVLTDTGDAGGDDLADVGTQAADGANPFGPVSSPFITLLPGTEPEGAEENAMAGGTQDDTGAQLIDGNGDMTVDFGFVPMLSVGSTVFSDTDGNSVQDGPGETGIAGATVNLYFDSNMDGVIDATELMNPIDMTTTGPNGDYLFEMLSPGLYQVGVVSDEALGTNMPSPIASPADDDIDGTNDGATTAIGAGFVSLSSVFELATGTEPVDGMGANDESGTNNMQDPGNDEDGNMTIDFGFVPSNSVGSTVFYDQNDDGIQAEPGTPQAIYEQGIPGIKVVLLQEIPDPDNPGATIIARVDSTTTDADGNYFFDMLPNGTFQVEIPDYPVGAPTNSTGQDTGDMTDGNDNGDQPGGIGTVTTSAPFMLMAGTEPVNGTGAGEEFAQGTDQDDPANGGIDANGNMTIDFGFIPNMSIGSQVFYDVDGDGIQNPADPREGGIEGAIVTLLVEDPANPGAFIPAPGIAPRTTGPDGLYFFGDLSPGNYQVQVTPSPNAPDSSGPANDPNTNVDGRNVGTQAAGVNGDPGLVTSATITLTPGAYNGLMEPRAGGEQDDTQGMFSEVNGLGVVDFSFAPVYDLALRKVFVPGTVPPIPGSTIDFDITVFNQGVTRVFDVDVIDYDITGVTFVSATGPASGMTIEGTPVIVTDNNDGTFQIDSLNGNESVVVRVQLMIDMPFNGTFPIINEAEITQFDNDEDATNDFPTDVDSTPDATQGNDPGGAEGTASDNSIDGDGLNGGGAPGDEDATTDEDDADVAIVQFLDLALTKELDLSTLAGGVATENDEITFDISVFNQGNVAVTNVDVIDYIPCGLDFVADPAVAAWTVTTDANGDDAVTTTIPGPIAPGAGVVVRVTFRIKTSGEIAADCPAGTTDPYINRAEITGQDDADGVEIPNTQDVDSTPDNDPGNDPGGMVNSNSDNAVAGDGLNGGGAPGDTDATTDEDDADPGNLQVFDVALNKVIDEGFAAPPYTFGSTVKFDITVFSQGNVPVSRVDVVDYLPPGLELTPGNPLNAGWAADGTTADGRTIIARSLTTADLGGAPLGFNESATVSVYLTVVPANPFDDEAYTNVAEVEEADGEVDDGAGGTNTVTFTQDADSAFDRDPTNNGGGLADVDDNDDANDSDDSVNGDGTGAPGDNSAATDQDNTDPAFVDVAAQSLGSTVFLDFNNNGMLDVGVDTGIAMVPVILLQEGTDGVFREVNVGPDGLLGTADDAPGGTLTDADGNYFFGQLPPGNYQVQVPASAFGGPLMDAAVSSNETTSGFMEQDPDGPTDAPGDDVDNDDNGTQDGGAGTQVTSGIISLVPNMEPENETGQGGDQDVAISDINGNMTLDLGFFEPVTVTGTIFVDVNADGRQDAGDVVLPGATITIIDEATGLPVDTDAEGNAYPNGAMTTAGVDGMYSFLNLPPGNYSVIVDNSTSDNAALYDFTTANNGDDAGDSDVVPAAPADETASSDDTGFINSGGTSDVLDAGLVCAITVEVAEPFTICSTGTIDLTDGAAVNPSSLLGGTWTTPDGTGDFLDADGNVLTPPYRLGTAVSFRPNSDDAMRGTVTLVLTSDDPGTLFPASVCEPVSNSVEVTILKVDCGQFFWDGGQ